MFIKTPPGRQRYSVLGAIDSHTHELITVRTAGTISADNVTALLDLIREKHPLVPVTLVMDNARYFPGREIICFRESEERSILRTGETCAAARGWPGCPRR